MVQAAFFYVSHLCFTIMRHTNHFGKFHTNIALTEALKSAIAGNALRDDLRKPSPDIARQRIHRDIQFLGDACVNRDNVNPAIIGFDEEAVRLPSCLQRISVVQSSEGEAKAGTQQLFGQWCLATEAMNNPQLRGMETLVDVEQFTPSTYAMNDEWFTQLLRKPHLLLKQLNLRPHRRFSQSIEPSLTNHHNLRMMGSTD